MPNPFVGNEDAAGYLDYFASSSMERDSVKRLYDEGIHRKREALRKVEADVYPKQQTPVLSNEALTDYLRRVKEAADRRQRKLVTLEQQLYGHPTPLLGKKELNQHVKHMYDDQVRRRQKRLEALESQRANSAKKSVPQKLAEWEVNREREAKWRPVATSPRREDGKRTMVYESPKRASSARPVHRDPAESQARLNHLSKPLRVFPKCDVKPKDGFNIYV